MEVLTGIWMVMVAVHLLPHLVRYVYPTKRIIENEFAVDYYPSQNLTSKAGKCTCSRWSRWILSTIRRPDGFWMAQSSWYQSYTSQSIARIDWIFSRYRLEPVQNHHYQKHLKCESADIFRFLSFYHYSSCCYDFYHHMQLVENNCSDGERV